MNYMPNLYSASKQIIFLLLLILSGGSASCTVHSYTSFTAFKKFAILPLYEESKTDNKWAEYLMRQSQNRVADKELISNNNQDNELTLTIYVHINPSAKYDYALSQTSEEKMYLVASNEENMLWLVYQWIAKVAETDKRWNASDLNPPIISLDNGERKFDFGYRSIYSPSMNHPDKIAIYGDQHVDYSWGLWGHNLRKVFSGSIPLEAQALVDGKRTEEQFCFSSEELYIALSEYILDSHGKGDENTTGWFAILPNDNDKICLCEKCKKTGNTAVSATPAVTSLLIRLAKEFPFHQFYTSAYQTTEEPTDIQLPQNTGVLISAIDLPLTSSPIETETQKIWENRLKQWKRVTDHIIVWDYMRNFDDYLTPYPFLTSIQKRLKWLKELEVYGVFYNGSGNDYASFDDVQTFLLSSLLKDTDIDISILTDLYLKQYYPVSHKVLFSYYTELEQAVHTHGYKLEWYAGINTALKTYLDASAFRKFYTELDVLSKQAGEEERNRLNKLLTALNFTQLEIIRSGDDNEKERTEEFLDLLKGAAHFKEMKVYKEAHGNLAEYIQTWKEVDFYHRDKENVIFGTDIKGYNLLTDGFYGFPNDYHLHWNIWKESDKTLVIKKDFASGKYNLVLSFLHAPAWRIGCPAKVEVYQKGILKGIWEATTDNFQSFSILKVPLSFNIESGSMEIRITKGKQPQTACDEIEMYHLTK